MATLPLRPVGAPLASDAHRNAERAATLDAALAEKLAVARAGWGAKYVDRVHEKGKLTTWERIAALKDADADVFEVGSLVNWGRDFAGSRRPAPGAGVVTVFTRVHDRIVVVIANDNTVASGAWWPLTPEKIERAQKMALRLRLPVLYLVDCSGLFLPEQSRSFAGGTGAGHIFKCNAELAAAGVPQVAAVFGDSIAGGGYMPIISDRVAMTESAYMVIAGAALIRGAKSQKLTSLAIGGPEVHVHQSRCADVRVPNDDTALAWLREEVAKLPSSAADFYRHGAEPAPPAFDPASLGAVFPVDPRQAYSADDVIARLVDDSLFHEVLAHVGAEVVTGLARVGGLWVGVVANRQGIVTEAGVGKRPGGALYREGIAKVSAFSRACNADGVPLLWLQDISGFDIGVQAERQGLLGYGSNLIYTNSTNDVPMFTVLLRKASGAGYYAMSGMPYDPVIQLATPITRLAVMEGRTLAIAAYNSKLDDDFEIATTDPEERAAVAAGMAKTAARIDADMDPVGAASRMDVDEIVPLDRLRAWLELLVEAAWQGSGYRRTKNPRIWSVLDLDVLSPPPPAATTRVARADADTLRSPTVGTFLRALVPGAPVAAGVALGTLSQAGAQVLVVAPTGTHGAAVVLAADGAWLAADDVVCVLGAGDAVVSGDAPEDRADVPEGVHVLCAETDGTVYLRPTPDDPLFVAVGDRVRAGDTVALVEVMKTFTPIRCPTGGVLLRVLVQEAASVEAGAALFWVRDADEAEPPRA